jgi:hypothetical protein
MTAFFWPLNEPQISWINAFVFCCTLMCLGEYSQAKSWVARVKCPCPWRAAIKVNVCSQERRLDNRNTFICLSQKQWPDSVHHNCFSTRIPGANTTFGEWLWQRRTWLTAGISSLVLLTWQASLRSQFRNILHGGNNSTSHHCALAFSYSTWPCSIVILSLHTADSVPTAEHKWKFCLPLPKFHIWGPSNGIKPLTVQNLLGQCFLQCSWSFLVKYSAQEIKNHLLNISINVTSLNVSHSYSGWMMFAISRPQETWLIGKNSEYSGVASVLPFDIFFNWCKIVAHIYGIQYDNSVYIHHVSDIFNK